jgi:hypothetical protein
MLAECNDAVDKHRREHEEYQSEEGEERCATTSLSALQAEQLLYDTKDEPLALYPQSVHGPVHPLHSPAAAAADAS